MVETHGRHDPCVGIRATPIAEAMLALVLIDHALRHRAQCDVWSVATPRIPGAGPRIEGVRGASKKNQVLPGRGGVLLPEEHIMQVEHHDLHHEFPDMHDVIHALKTSQPSHLKLFDEYQTA